MRERQRQPDRQTSEKDRKRQRDEELLRSIPGNKQHCKTFI